MAKRKRTLKPERTRVTLDLEDDLYQDLNDLCVDDGSYIAAVVLRKSIRLLKIVREGQKTKKRFGFMDESGQFSEIVIL